MLYSTDDRQPKKEAHEAEFQARRSAISDADYKAMVDAINAFCDRTYIFCASSLPGQDAAISAAFPPLTEACGGSREESGLFFGNIVWRVICDRADEWYFQPADKESGYPWGMRYWRKRSSD
jgi:hypothetical protein